MAKATLVEPDIRLGEEILSVLDRAGFPVRVALWLQEREDDPWELRMASPRYKEPDAHRQLVDALERDLPGWDVKIRLVDSRDPLIKALRKAFSKCASVHGMRLGLQTIGGLWINDAYIYRIK